MNVRRILRRTGFSLLALVVLLVATLAAFYVAALLRETRSAGDVAPSGGRVVSGGDVGIFIQERGPASGPPVLLVHGTGAWSSIWEGTMDALAAHGYHAIALDMPPFGFSGRPADASYAPPDQGRRIVAVISSLNLTNVTLVGHSFQARGTVEAAFAAPERISRLVLVDAALDLNAANETENPILRVAMAVRPLREAIVASTFEDPFLTKPFLQHLLANRSAATPERVAMLQRPLVQKGLTPDAGRWLAEFLAPERPSLSNNGSSYARPAMPVLLIWGEADSVTPLAKGESLALLVPHARLVVIPRAGHIPQIEEPVRFEAALNAFLADGA